MSLTIPAGLFLADGGGSVLLYQEGDGTLQVAAADGVELRVRSGLNPSLAGKDSVATLIWRAPNVFLLCGDLESL